LLAIACIQASISLSLSHTHTHTHTQTIDADMKRELRLLRLRGAYDTKRFYKSFDSTK